MFDNFLWFFNVNITKYIRDNEKSKTENVPGMLIVHTYILLMIYS